jgi:hypothetical protein
MITGWILCFVFGVVTGRLGSKANVPILFNLILGAAMSMAIAATCQQAGLP